MDLSEYMGEYLNETQKIILERVKKTLSGLTIKEAKEVLYEAVRNLDEDVILSYPSSKK